MDTVVNRDRDTAIGVVKRTLSADYGCAQGALDDEAISFCVAKRSAGSRAFPLPERFLAVVSMGKGTVVSCSPERLGWAKANLSRLSSDKPFSAPAIARMQNYVSRAGQFMAGPDLKYICTYDDYRPGNPGLDIESLEGEHVRELYPDDSFPNALGQALDPQRPTMIVSLARRRGKIVGVAAATADCDLMWQVGVDTLPDRRGEGLGKALVSRLTERVLQKGRLPYYSTWISNIASQRTAASVGYRLAWVELYSRHKPF